MLEKIIKKVFKGEPSISNSQKVYSILNALYEYIKHQKTSDLIDQKLIEETPQLVIDFFEKLEDNEKEEFFGIYTLTNENLHFNEEKIYEVFYFPNDLKEKVLMLNEILALYEEKVNLEFFDFDS